ncbi:glycogen operon protein [Phycicoccus badiiscoriae]|uniref:Glycogen operon protein n=1 Tax=Pedococcus badiiscoriae TaxID=642776 RepID=A0A852WFV6_9MICO|nr:glycogen debranching protein GlgX [Pedococcus badiiscoriae]NYG07858.1 glycogen operon protein [Pedococcus badiiscoriae]
MSPAPRTRDLPPTLGMTLVEGGAEFAVYAGHADSVEVCLFDGGDQDGHSERRVPLTERTHGIWFGFLPGVGAGQRYGLRADGPWRPAEGLRYNPAKVLLDPYARAIEGDVSWTPEVFAHRVGHRLKGDDAVLSTLDSAGAVPRCVVVDERFDWGDDAPPHTPLSETVVYEAHVRNLTMRHPEVPAHLRGTYAGMCHPSVIAHLKALGATAVELLPVQAFTSEPEVVQRGLTNHWGYNTLGFFAPHARYASASDPQGALDEFKGMVRLLHSEGIEVVLDVVYNHTAEQAGRDGASLSWRGLDNRAYYRLDERGQDIDVTGCGNTLDLRHAMVCRMVLDSLRYWVNECHVDGFRFDLAVALGRGQNDDYDPNHPFLVALRTDPVLSRVKLIAEPWDVGIHGWRTGQFPPPFAEWNDRFRDSVRTFWLDDLKAQAAGHHQGHGVRELATRMAGSQDLFGSRDRGPVASVNFVAAHDGFTTTDLTRYNAKHNGPNGEGNRDGSDNNRSWNHGVEGPETGPAEPEIEQARRRSTRNLLATTLLATGVPMLNAGDEFGRSQGGNNNPYCQDNETSWFHWGLAGWQQDLLATTRFLTRLRTDHPVLRQPTFFTGREVHEDGSTDLAWFDADGQPMENGRWEDPSTRTLQMLLNGACIGQASVLVVLHGGREPEKVMLPEVPGLAAYHLLWDSTDERPGPPDPPTPPGPVEVGPTCIQVYRAAAST